MHCQHFSLSLTDFGIFFFLKNSRTSIRAPNGVAGGNSDLDGRNAENLVVDVPVGLKNRSFRVLKSFLVICECG